MPHIRFQQVDVFTSVRFKGNPVAVVLDGDGFSTEQMQEIAHWTNLSETTFVLPPTDATADYRLRIFTPSAELPFAGHPTIGSARAILNAGYIPKQTGHLIQECGKGLVDLMLHHDRLFFRLPTPTFTSPESHQIRAAADALGVPASAIDRVEIIDVGPVWFTLQLRDGHDVAKLKPNMAAIAALSPSSMTGLNVFHIYKNGGPADIEVRSFAPAHGVAEDPVCGSGNGCVAALIQRYKLLGKNSYTANQGRCLHRDGRVHVRLEEDGAIWLGGDAVTCVEGFLTT
jgi:PhzF family phenazine biosynthesis protein